MRKQAERYGRRDGKTDVLVPRSKIRLDNAANRVYILRMTLAEQAEQYLKTAQSRKRGPIGVSSLAGYSSYIRRWIVPELGSLNLEDVKPSTVKPLIEKMVREELSAATINQVVAQIKRIMNSALDLEGQPLYPRKWDNAFLDVPVVDKADQDAPVLAPSELLQAISGALDQNKVLYTILAATGARYGEIAALRARPECDTDSYWDAEKGVIFIRSTFTHNTYQPWPKTDAGNREIDLHPAVNTYLKKADLPKTGWLFRGVENPESHYCLATASRHLKEDGIDKGFHSFRRFRITHLESQSVPRGLQMFWTGHAAKNVHETYIRMGENIEARKYWAEKAGLGFSL